MKAEPCKIVENTREDSRTHEKTMKNEAAQAKSEGQHIHGTFHTRQVHTSCKWGHTKMAHPSPNHSIGEDYAKMKAEPCKIVENTLGDSRAHEKTMKNEAAQGKSEGQHIHGTFHTRQVHTSCKWGHTKMAHPSPDHSIGEDYAKMKAEPCKIVENTLGDSRTHEKTMKNEAAQAKSEGQHIHGTFHTRQVHTSCKWGHTKMAHPSPDHSIGEDYAKMKAEPCKIGENTRGDSRTHEKNHEK